MALLEVQPVFIGAVVVAVVTEGLAVSRRVVAVDREQVRAAVILALEASMITMIENITDKVVVALESEARPKMTPATALAEPKPAITVAPAPKPAAPFTQPAAARETPKTGPPAPPEEPVVRIRTPIFRTLS